ncbi:MAG: hypothetical protein KGS72_23065 [Cyanobacteria bacterium REEB67]|nr:hypothetical protein [Cyanobacteria bacterium REEB67]
MHSAQFRYLIDDGQYANQYNLVAEAVYRLCVRSCFAPPGFALVRQMGIASAREQRQSIVDLKENLSLIHQSRSGQSLGWVSLACDRVGGEEGRKLHRENAPSQSLLLLGLAPSRQPQRVLLADYAACASELGLSPVQFLEEFTPVFKKFMNILAPYTMALNDLEQDRYYLLAINNSDSSLGKKDGLWQGLLHAIKEPTQSYDLGCVEPLACGADEAVKGEEIEAFLAGH